MWDLSGTISKNVHNYVFMSVLSTQTYCALVSLIWAFHIERGSRSVATWCMATPFGQTTCRSAFTWSICQGRFLYMCSFYHSIISMFMLLLACAVQVFGQIVLLCFVSFVLVFVSIKPSTGFFHRPASPQPCLHHYSYAVTTIFPYNQCWV